MLVTSFNSLVLYLGINCIDTWGKWDGRNVVYLLNLRIDKNFTLLCSEVRIFANNTLLGTSHIMIVHNPGELGGVRLIQKPRKIFGNKQSFKTQTTELQK